MSSIRHACLIPILLLVMGGGWFYENDASISYHYEVQYSIIKLKSGVKNFHHLASNFDVTTQGGDIIIW